MKEIVNFCEDELNYHINDCDCREYQSEIKAQIKLLELLGYDERSLFYKEQYKEQLSNK